MCKTTDAEWHHWDKIVYLTEIEICSHYYRQQFWGNSNEFQGHVNVWSTHYNITINLILIKFSKIEKSTHDISSMSLCIIYPHKGYLLKAVSPSFISLRLTAGLLSLQIILTAFAGIPINTSQEKIAKPLYCQWDKVKRIIRASTELFSEKIKAFCQ